MNIKGILDFSLGNFLCLRGFAPMGVLQDLSAPPEDIQRVPPGDRLEEIGNYLRKGELVFFPEVILCMCLHEDEVTSEAAEMLFSNVKTGQPFKGTFSNGIAIQSKVEKGRGAQDLRAVDFFQTATLTIKGELQTLFARLDGNHRLSASKDHAVRDRITPFCLILCQNIVDFRRFSRSLFHNINHKQVPLTMEHNLKLILEDNDLFPDDLLKDDPSFGWQYYLTRNIQNNLDFDFLTSIRPFLASEPRKFLLQQFHFFAQRGVLPLDEKAILPFKNALSAINGVIGNSLSLQDSKNPGLIGALLYYEISSKDLIPSFVSWVLHNNLHLIDDIDATDLISVFDKVLESRKRTIFVSMPFGRPVTEDHYAVILRVVQKINDAYSLKPPLKVERVDWFHDGTSYEINDKIIEMMNDCGLLIGNLTYCNPNVYHEIGFIMGKAKARSEPSANVLLFLDESVDEEADKFVGFNLRGIKQLRFQQLEKQFAPVLQANLEKFFKLN